MDKYIILIQLILAHLFSDFILQPTSWVINRKEKHYSSPYLYLHGLVTVLTAWLLTGFNLLLISLIIGVTHILIDGWKSYRPEKTFYFVIDQAMHLFILLTCWYFKFLHLSDLKSLWSEANTTRTWVILSALVFLTTPSGIMIGQMTKKWRVQIPDSESLANAGIWIGIIERLLIFILVYKGQYGALGLLITAKGILRFRDNDRTEIKTEYLLIGTLISVGFAIITGVFVLTVT